MDFTKEVDEVISASRTFSSDLLKEYIESMFKIAYIQGQRDLLVEQRNAVNEVK
jgi:hypothetical protein